MKVTFLDNLVLMFFSLLDICKHNKRTLNRRKSENLKRKK